MTEQARGPSPVPAGPTDDSHDRLGSNSSPAAANLVSTQESNLNNSMGAADLAPASNTITTTLSTSHGVDNRLDNSTPPAGHSGRFAAESPGQAGDTPSGTGKSTSPANNSLSSATHTQIPATIHSSAEDVGHSDDGLPSANTIPGSGHNHTDLSEGSTDTAGVTPSNNSLDSTTLVSDQPSRRSPQTEPLVVPLQMQYFDGPDVAQSRDGLLFPVYRRVEHALQLAMASTWQQEAMIDHLLLIESRLEKARTRADQRAAMQVLAPVRAILADEFEVLGFPELRRNLDRLLLMLGPMLSRMPIRLHGKIYALLRFGELAVKVVMNHDSGSGEVVDRVVRAMMHHAAAPSTKEIIATIANTLGEGPPYAVLSVTPPHGGSPDNTGLGPDLDPGYDLPHDTAFEEFLRRAWDTEKGRHNRPNELCHDCWRARREVQENLIDALAQAGDKLEKQIYDAENELVYGKI